MERPAGAGRNVNGKEVLVGASAGQVMVRCNKSAVVAKFEDDVIELKLGGVGLPKIGATERRRIFRGLVRRKFLPFDWDGVGRASDDVRRE